MLNVEDYRGREQAFVKHTVLQAYLRQLAFKVGQFRPGTTLNYVDGFSGPWQHGTEDFRDTSPAIAMRELTQTRETLAQAKNPVELQVRCLFVEKDPTAFGKLQDLVAGANGIEAVTLRGEFEARIPDVVEFASWGRQAFAFVFIDPTGWTGFGLRAITPLLRVEPGEALINLMTKDIKRFIDDDDSSAMPTFRDLFGEAHYREAWRGLGGREREDAIVTRYCERVRSEGHFDHCVSTVVLNPLEDRTHYHLVYATRSLKGLETFRNVERTALSLQRLVRASAQQHTREERNGQAALFAPMLSETSYAADLQRLYHAQARDRVLRILQTEAVRIPIAFDTVAASAMQSPMTSVGDLKEWLTEWKGERRLEYKGLGPRERVPKIGRGHRVWWQGQ